MDELIRDFMRQGPYAVVGASADRSKYGNLVLRAYQAQGLEVYPVNPRGGVIEGLVVHPDLASVPVQVRAVSIITPPEITEQVVREAARAGVSLVWMQPGAESSEAMETARNLGLQVIAGGPCYLVLARLRRP